MTALTLFGEGAPALIRKHDAFIKTLMVSHDERVCIGEIDGVLVICHPFYTDRKHERSRLFIGENKLEFGLEWTWIPWNFLKPITTKYWIWIDVETRAMAANILKKAGIEGQIEPDPYAEPERFHLWLDSLEDVVKVFKITNA